MDALILAAGRGSRLACTHPKCLVPLGGRTLLQIQIDQLRRCGVDNVTVVVGYRYRDVVDAAWAEASFVFNEDYASTNSMFSFHLAGAAVADQLVDDLLVLNSDVVFPLEILRRVLAPSGSAFAFDSSSGSDAEHMKVHLRNGDLVRMSKALPAGVTAGENVGILRLDASTARAVFAAASMLVGAGRHQAWVGSAISSVAAEHRIQGVDIAGLPWVEIDYPEDLALARDQVWPAIEHLDRASPDGARVFDPQPAVTR